MVSKLQEELIKKKGKEKRREKAAAINKLKTNKLKRDLKGDKGEFTKEDERAIVEQLLAFIRNNVDMFKGEPGETEIITKQEVVTRQEIVEKPVNEQVVRNAVKEFVKQNPELFEPKIIEGEDAPTIKALDIDENKVVTTLSDGSQITGKVTIKFKKTQQLGGIQLQRFIRIFSDDGTVDVTKTNTGFDLSIAAALALQDEFTELTDTPADYTDDALKVLRVNAAEDAVEFFDIFGSNNTWSGNNIYNGSSTFNGITIIDRTSTEAFLVRKDGDGGDVWTIDTTNVKATLGNATITADATTQYTTGGVLQYATGHDQSATLWALTNGTFTGVNYLLTYRKSDGLGVTHGDFQVLGDILIASDTNGLELGASAEYKVSASSVGIKIAGQNQVNNEDILLDLESVANTMTVTSSTGLILIDLSGIGITVGGAFTANGLVAKNVLEYNTDANFTITTEYHVDVNDDTNWTVGRSIFLPATPVDGEEHIVSKAGSSFTVTIDGNGNNINAAGTDTLTSQFNSATYRFMATAGVWRKV